MGMRFNANDVERLSYNAEASRCQTIDMDVNEGWLYISTDTIDDRNRTIEYSCTFPLDEWMLGEVRKSVMNGGVPCWETGECQYRSRGDYDLNWHLLIATSEEEFEYNGLDAFPRGYDELENSLHMLAVSLFDRFRFDLDNLKNIYLSTDARLNNDTFSLTGDSLHVIINDRCESLGTVPEYLEDVKTILKDYLLCPDEPKECRPMEHGKCICLNLADKYENRFVLWWGEDRPPWADDMIQRLYDVLKTAYRDVRTVVKSIDPFLPRDPEKYCLTVMTKNIFLDELNKIGGTLPVGQSSLIEVWNRIRRRRETLLRRSCIGDPWMRMNWKDTLQPVRS